MDNFEYLLTLFGLLLGLALAEGLGGLAAALNARTRVQVGWPTALLGIYVSCNVVSFWINGWLLRDDLQINWPTVFSGFVLTAIAYVSASLVFPKHPEDQADFDAHFERNRSIVVGGLLVCNAALLATISYYVDVGNLLTFRRIVIIWLVYPAGLIVMMSRRRGLVMAALIFMIATYPLSLIWR